MHSGVFCLEGEWFGNYKKPTSVEPVLQLLSAVQGQRIPYIHRNVDTRAELNSYIGKWLQKAHASHPILYLAFHGSRGKLHVGDQRRAEGQLGLEELEGLIGKNGEGRVLYFGSCSTLGVHGNRIKSFVSRTKLAGVVGYRSDVDWIESSLVDAYILYHLCTQGEMNARVVVNAKDAAIRGMGGICKDLKLVTEPSEN